MPTGGMRIGKNPQGIRNATKTTCTLAGGKIMMNMLTMSNQYQIGYKTNKATLTEAASRMPRPRWQQGMHNPNKGNERRHAHGGVEF